MIKRFPCPVNSFIHSLHYIHCVDYFPCYLGCNKSLCKSIGTQIACANNEVYPKYIGLWLAQFLTAFFPIFVANPHAGREGHIDALVEPYHAHSDQVSS